jgi:DNA-binding response OmpR family regulator
MAQSTRVLLLTREPAIQNLVEQVCHIDGHRTVTVATVDEAHALAAPGGRDAFALAVMDTAAFGVSEQQQPHLARQLWQEWSAAYPGLPLLFVGTLPQDYGFLADRADLGVFLEKPFGPRLFADTMRTVLPGP